MLLPDTDLEQASGSCPCCDGGVYYTPRENLYMYICSDCGHEFDDNDTYIPSDNHASIWLRG